MQLLRELIQISIGKASRFNNTPTPREWELLYLEARKQAVLGVTWKALETVPEEQLTNPDISAKWRDKMEKIAIMGEVYDEHNARVSRTLAEMGYRCSFLKGEGLASVIYPEPFLRQCGDIDVWIDGGRKEIIRALRTKFRVNKIYYHECKVGFFNHLTVEAHFIPTRMYNPFSNYRLQRYFRKHIDSAMTNMAPGREYCTPDNCFNAIYLMAHIYRHALDGGVGLRHIWDYYYVLESLTPEQKKSSWRDLRRLGMGGITSEVMYILSTLFGVKDKDLLCRPAQRRGRKLVSEIKSEGNFGMGSAHKSRPSHESSFARFRRKTRKSMHYASRFPSEVLWMPFSRLWHFLWRKANKIFI